LISLVMIIVIAAIWRPEAKKKMNFFNPMKR